MAVLVLGVHVGHQRSVLRPVHLEGLALRVLEPQRDNDLPGGVGQLLQIHADLSVQYALGDSLVHTQIFRLQGIPHAGLEGGAHGGGHRAHRGGARAAQFGGQVAVVQRLPAALKRHGVPLAGGARLHPAFDPRRFSVHTSFSVNDQPGGGAVAGVAALVQNGALRRGQHVVGHRAGGEEGEPQILQPAAVFIVIADLVGQFLRHASGEIGNFAGQLLHAGHAVFQRDLHRRGDGPRRGHIGLFGQFLPIRVHREGLPLGEQVILGQLVHPEPVIGEIVGQAVAVPGDDVHLGDFAGPAPALRRNAQPHGVFLIRLQTGNEGVGSALLGKQHGAVPVFAVGAVLQLPGGGLQIQRHGVAGGVPDFRHGDRPRHSGQAEFLHRGGKLLRRGGQIQVQHIPRPDGGRRSDKVVVTRFGGAGAFGVGPAQVVLIAAQFGGDGHGMLPIPRGVVRLEHRQGAALRHHDGDGLAIIFHQFPIAPLTPVYGQFFPGQFLCVRIREAVGFIGKGSPVNAAGIIVQNCLVLIYQPIPGPDGHGLVLTVKGRVFLRAGAGQEHIELRIVVPVLGNSHRQQAVA